MLIDEDTCATNFMVGAHSWPWPSSSLYGPRRDNFIIPSPVPPLSRSSSHRTPPLRWLKLHLLFSYPNYVLWLIAAFLWCCLPDMHMVLGDSFAAAGLEIAQLSLPLTLVTLT